MKPTHLAERASAAAVTDLTSTAQDYLKAIWSATEWDGDPATVKSLAARFDVTPASASDTIRRLTADGLVEHERYGPITLTDIGRQHALEMVRRHRLIETFLANILDFDPDQVHDEADNLEHSVSDLFLDRIDALLGHPRHDPHGDPIPTKDGTISFPSDSVQLAHAEAGLFTITRLSDADPARLAHLTANSIKPGDIVTVHRADDYSPVTLTTTDGTHVTLNEYTAEGVYLTPENTSSEPASS